MEFEVWALFIVTITSITLAIVEKFKRLEANKRLERAKISLMVIEGGTLKRVEEDTVESMSKRIEGIHKIAYLTRKILSDERFEGDD